MQRVVLTRHNHPKVQCSHCRSSGNGGIRIEWNAPIPHQRASTADVIFLQRLFSRISKLFSDLALQPGAKMHGGNMRLCLVEDHSVCRLEPLVLTRPVHELMLGASTLESKISHAMGIGPGPQRRSCVIRSHLVDVQRQRVPHMVVNDRDWLARGPVIVAKGRWVPPEGFAMPDRYGSWVGLCEGEPALAWVGPDDAVLLEPQGVESWFERMVARAWGSGSWWRVD